MRKKAAQLIVAVATVVRAIGVAKVARWLGRLEQWGRDNK